MGKTLYSVAMSLDGFITGPGGDMSWMVDYLGPNPEFDELTPRIGSLLVGRRTFGGDDPYKGTEHEGEPFGGGWSGPQFVVTHHPPARSMPGIIFVTDLESGLAQAQTAAGDRYVNVLGASIARQLLERNELDEVFVCVAPVMLGDGVRLFDYPGGKTIKLERIGQSAAQSASNLWYRVVK